MNEWQFYVWDASFFNILKFKVHGWILFMNLLSFFYSDVIFRDNSKVFLVSSRQKQSLYILVEGVRRGRSGAGKGGKHQDTSGLIWTPSINLDLEQQLFFSRLSSSFTKRDSTGTRMKNKQTIVIFCQTYFFVYFWHLNVKEYQFVMCIGWKYFHLKSSTRLQTL